MSRAMFTPTRPTGPATASPPTTSTSCARMSTPALSRIILDEIEHPHEIVPAEEAAAHIRPDQALDDEGLAHQRFAEERLRFFVGRSEMLAKIAGYLHGQRTPQPGDRRGRRHGQVGADGQGHPADPGSRIQKRRSSTASSAPPPALRTGAACWTACAARSPAATGQTMRISPSITATWSPSWASACSWPAQTGR